MYLAGDIGGTKADIAIYDNSSGRLEQVSEETFPSRLYPTFELLLADFFAKRPTDQLAAACFGVAGTVVEGHCHTTNLPWDLDEKTLADELGVKRVKLLNDLEAAAYGMLHVAPEEMTVLQPGRSGKRSGNVAVIAAGTGLGEAILFWDGERYHPIASEGGHADFAPSSPRQAELWKYLSAKLSGHVSWERVLSGPGLHNIYDFLRDSGEVPESAEVAESLKSGDPNAAISRYALAGTDPLCVAAVDLFCSIYGSEAGNMALRCVAVGGVFVGGGIAPKLLPALQKGEFNRAFAAKGRFRPLLETIEVSVALNPRVPLLGAAQYALRL